MPSVPTGTESTIISSPPVISDRSYFYLGYALPDEKTALAFLSNYLEMSSDTLSEHDVSVQIDGQTRTIHALREGDERFFATDENMPKPASLIPGRIPIVVERPENHGDGGHVLYMDGHVEFIPYPGKYPMTKAVIEKLEQLSHPTQTVQATAPLRPIKRPSFWTRFFRPRREP